MKSLLKFVAPVAMAGAATAAFAGSGGSEFSAVETLITDWTEGVVGRILAVGALLIGIAFGLVRQSVVAAVVGIAMAVVLAYGPGVITNIVGATASDAAAGAVATLANGLM